MTWRWLVLLATACSGGAEEVPVDARPRPPSSCDRPARCSICSPLTQSGCSAQEKCAWTRDTLDVGHIGCVPDGPVPVGGACTFGHIGPQGYSNCAKGSECVGGICQRICDHQGGLPGCDEQHTCAPQPNLFESGDVTVAGVCELRCDPLTQVRVDGAPACGSPDPAMPAAGCYSHDGVQFACDPVPAGALALTDRMPAQRAPDGTVLVNGCAPGFLPLFHEVTGSTTIVCAGTCAPVRTDNQNTANASGDPLVPAKLPPSPTPEAGDAICVTGKKGSRPAADQQNCLFLSHFRAAAPATLGVCFDHRAYSYDHDNTAATPERPHPSCIELPPKGDVADCTCDAMGTSCTGDGCPDGQAHEWGCYPATAAPPTRLRDFRIGARGARVVVRHAIDASTPRQPR